MKKLHRMNYLLVLCFSLLFVGCGISTDTADRADSDLRTNIDENFAEQTPIQYPALVRAKEAPKDVVYIQDALGEQETYQYYYICETEDRVIGSIAIDFETVNIEDYGLTEDIAVIQDDSLYYINIWTGPGENRNYIYHSEEKVLQQLAYGHIRLTEDYLYIQGIVLAVDGGAPLHIYSRSGEHICQVTDNSTEYKLLGEHLYYIENEMVEDEKGSYKLHSYVKEASLNGENVQQVCEIVADTLPEIHEGYVTYEDDGSTHSVEFMQ